MRVSDPDGITGIALGEHNHYRGDSQELKFELN
jgi:hypothetical protein